MATWYICPSCTRSINRLFALPPVRVMAICRHCGHPVERCVGSIAQAWLFFTPLVILPLTTLLFHLADPEPLCQTSFCYCLGKAVPVTALCVPLGGLLGGAVGVLIGAPWKGRSITGAQLYLAASAYQASRPDPQFNVLLADQQGGTAEVKEIRCWHHLPLPRVPSMTRVLPARPGIGMIRTGVRKIDHETATVEVIYADQTTGTVTLRPKETKEVLHKSGEYGIRVSLTAIRNR